jgi:alginate O-acetyltransferase complex protein AlgJ
MSTASPRHDPLALPPVPPPARSDHPARDRILVALFGMALAVALAGTIIKRNVTITTYENRSAAPWPSRPTSLAEARAWPAKFEAAFADRFGGRNTLIALHHWTKAVGFGVSPAANVVIGRDGWLFFRGEDGRALDRDYRGTVPYPADEPSLIAAEFKRRHDFVSALGIAYVVMIVPDKATIYPEYLPRWVTKVAPQTRLDRLYAALAAYPEIAVLDLRPALTAAKARERDYFKTDSHWNLVGATIGYETLAAVLKAKVPGFPGAPPERPPYVPGVDFYSGDLAQMIGSRGGAFREEDIAPLGKVLANEAGHCAKPVAAPPASGTEAEPDMLIYACARPGLPAAVVYRDSMAISLMPLLSENFRRVVYLTRRFERSMIERERPDVVIEELVERTLHGRIAFPM